MPFCSISTMRTSSSYFSADTALWLFFWFRVQRISKMVVTHWLGWKNLRIGTLCLDWYKSGTYASTVSRFCHHTFVKFPLEQRGMNEIQQRTSVQRPQTIYMSTVDGFQTRWCDEVPTIQVMQVVQNFCFKLAQEDSSRHDDGVHGLRFLEQKNRYYHITDPLLSQNALLRWCLTSWFKSCTGQGLLKVWV